LFEQLVSWIATYIKVQMNANLVATGLFVFFYAIIIENKYVCPELDETFELKLKRKTSCYRKQPVGCLILQMMFSDREHSS
jgi:DNA mismatch repair protein MutS